MSWDKLTTILTRELGAAEAERLAAVLVAELGSLRVQIPRPHPATGTRRPSREEILAALERNRWRVDETARELGIHRVTVYRALERQAAPSPPVGPALAGRIVR